METTPEAIEIPQSLLNPVKPWLVWLITLGSLLIIGAWTLATPSGVGGKTDAVGYAICHRIESRSFSAFGHQLPLCARCTGIYLGVMTGFIVYVASGRGKVYRFPPWKHSAVLLLSVAVIGIDGVNSYLHLILPEFRGLYEPNNTLRLITGMYAGLAFITLVLPLFNNMMWAGTDHRRLLETWKELAGLLFLVTLVTLVTLTRLQLVLLIFGWISAFGVVLMLTLINSVMVASLLKRERQYRQIREMWLPLLAGVAMALVLIGTIDYFRYSVTHTWDGFNFMDPAWLNLWKHSLRG
jgi:uncharacterized membrane protein